MRPKAGLHLVENRAPKPVNSPRTRLVSLFNSNDRLVFGWPLKTAPPFRKQRGDQRTAQSNKLLLSRLRDLWTTDGEADILFTRWLHRASPSSDTKPLSAVTPTPQRTILLTFSTNVDAKWCPLEAPPWIYTVIWLLGSREASGIDLTFDFRHVLSGKHQLNDSLQFLVSCLQLW